MSHVCYHDNCVKGVSMWLWCSLLYALAGLIMLAPLGLFAFVMLVIAYIEDYLGKHPPEMY